MDRKDRIQTLEKTLGSRVIVYLTGDRQPFVTRIAGDIIPMLDELLENIGRAGTLSLFLYTGGGDMLAPLRIVKLLRNHADRFEVVVPYRAYSAGTLIALGADRIFMGKLGELSPVDPKTGHPFNPENPLNPKQKLEISVEDLNSYFLLAREKAGIAPEQMADVYRLLVEKIHPLSLGNAYRAYRMARMLTARLLEMHMDKERDASRIGEIVQQLTGDITIHNYPVDRDEARAMGLKVEPLRPQAEKAIRDLYEAYAETMKLASPFNPGEFLLNRDLAEFEYTGAYLETTAQTWEYVFRGRAQRGIRNNQPVVDMNILGQSWVKK